MEDPKRTKKINKEHSLEIDCWIIDDDESCMCEMYIIDNKTGNEIDCSTCSLRHSILESAKYSIDDLFKMYVD